VSIEGTTSKLLEGRGLDFGHEVSRGNMRGDECIFQEHHLFFSETRANSTERDAVRDFGVGSGSCVNNKGRY
jgi:hypothetical protein